MRVYRYLTEDELYNILNDKIENLGGKYYGMNNSFAYKRDCRYIHFFKYLSDVEYIRDLKRWRIEQGDYDITDFFVCEFEIPASILLFSSGEGIYKQTEDKLEGKRVKEFAVKVNKFKSKWLKHCVKDNLFEPFDPQQIQERFADYEISESEPMI